MEAFLNGTGYATNVGILYARTMILSFRGSRVREATVGIPFQPYDFGKEILRPLC
jgi:hypothetical protein